MEKLKLDSYRPIENLKSFAEVFKRIIDTHKGDIIINTALGVFVQDCYDQVGLDQVITEELLTTQQVMPFMVAKNDNVNILIDANMKFTDLRILHNGETILEIIANAGDLL